jgi:hypothetical protein
MHLEDQARFGDHRDQLFGATFWQNVGKELQLDLRYTRIADEDRDARARAMWRVAEWGLFAQLSYYNLLQPQGDLVLEADPYFNALNTLQPFDQWTLVAGKDIGEMVGLQAAADLRNVRDSGDIGFYNRDFDHYYGTATLSRFGVDGLTLAATIDYWDSNAQIVRSWGFDATYALDESTVSAGTYYSLYKYDLFSNSERDHVRTYYLRLSVPTSDAVTLDGDYEFEDVDFGDFHRFRLGFTWRF